MTRSSAKRQNGNARRIARLINFEALGKWYHDPFTAVSAQKFTAEMFHPEQIGDVNWTYLAELMNRNIGRVW